MRICIHGDTFCMTSCSQLVIISSLFIFFLKIKCLFSKKRFYELTVGLMMRDPSTSTVTVFGLSGQTGSVKNLFQVFIDLFALRHFWKTFLSHR